MFVPPLAARLTTIAARSGAEPLTILSTVAGPGLRRGLALLLLALAVLAAGPATAQKYAAIVIDARTGEVLHETDADATRHPASLTKMMTLYLTFEALDEGRLTLDQPLPVSAYATTMTPTKLGLRPGQTLRVEQAILGLVTKSANDAAVVLAEALGGSEERFAELMTRKARALGMRNTIFYNASGLPDDRQVTTARDFSLLSRALINDHPKYYPYFSRRSFAYGGRSLANHNHLMSRYEGMDGIKTGYVRASGFNLAASAVRGGRRLIAVVMGGTSALARDNRMAALLDAAFERGGVPARDSGALVAAKAATVTPPSRKPAAAPTSIAQLAAAHVRPPPRASGDDDEDEWGVQIGAFASKAQGKRALAEASKHVPKKLAGAEKSLTEVATRKGTMYRARFVGLEEREARELCTNLKKAGRRCIPVELAAGT